MTTIEIRTILVPTDFSDCSLEAMRYAMDLAAMFSARVVFLHVVEPPAYGPELAGLYPGYAPDVTKKLADMMHDWVEQVRVQGIRVEWHIAVGSSYAEIRAAVPRYGVDLIVMGTHGRTGFSHAFWGSVAERVVQHASCPVLTIKTSRSVARQSGSAASTTTAPSEPRGETVSRCRVCGAPSAEIICDACKTRIQAEAVARKREIEKEGRVGTGGRSGV
ncbi:MAG: universal stress protein [Nitrospirota bacterium]